MIIFAFFISGSVLARQSNVPFTFPVALLPGCRRLQPQEQETGEERKGEEEILPAVEEVDPHYAAPGVREERQRAAERPPEGLELGPRQDERRDQDRQCQAMEGKNCRHPSNSEIPSFKNLTDVTT